MSDQERNREVYAETGGIGFSDNTWNSFSPPVLFFEEVKRRELVKSLYLAGIEYRMMRDLKILEIGCGWGQTLRMFVDLGAVPGNCHGVDINGHFIARAREINQGMHFYESDACSLEFKDNSFDIVCQYYSFSSILDEKVRKKIASEMSRIVGGKGIILWEDAASRNDVFYYKSGDRNELRYRGIPESEIKGLFPGAPIISRKTSLTNVLSYNLPGFSISKPKKVFRNKIVDDAAGDKFQWRPYPWCIAEMLNIMPFLRRSLHCMILPSSS